MENHDQVAGIVQDNLWAGGPIVKMGDTFKGGGEGKSKDHVVLPNPD